MTDDLTAQLAEWGEDFEEEPGRAVAEEDASLTRSLSLLAAVEAALKLADEWEADITADAYAAQFAYNRCADTLRAAITGALGGTQPGKDENHDRTA